jgi:hypothetical protein
MLFAQAIDPSGIAGSGWANATIGGVAVALLVVLAYFLKLWVEERKTYNENQRVVTDQLVAVIRDNGIITAGNTAVIASTIKQTDSMVGKIDVLTEKLSSRPCLLQPDVTYRGNS